jgi:tetratricopeptide (TPR) repeat protein
MRNKLKHFVIFGPALLAGLLLPGCGRLADGFARLRADALRAANQHDKAIVWYTRIATNRQDAAVLRALVAAYAQQNDPTNLAATCARLATVATNLAEVRTLVITLLDSDNAPLAIPHIRHLITLAPDNWTYKDVLVTALRDAGQTNAIPRALRRFARSMPATSTNFARLGLLWLDQDDTRNGIVCLSRALALAPRHQALRRTLAATLLETKQYDAALATLAGLASNQVARADVQLLLADAYHGDGQTARALPHYRRAIQRAPHHAVALNNYAYCLLQHGGNLSEAYELALSAVQQERKPYALDTLALACYQKGANDTALRLLRETEQMVAADGAALDPEIHYHFGLCYAARSDMTNAVRRFRTALAQQPALRADLARHPFFKTIESQLPLPHELLESTP